MAGGVLPVLKHLPGHGRAAADSHHRLPVVDTDRATLEATDFAAFRPLADLPIGMTAHVVFSAIDPVAPATTSVTMVRDVIRGFIGFQGLLMSDDVSMNALSGTHRRAQPRSLCRRLRCRAPLQRRPRRDGRGRRRSARCWRAWPRRAPTQHLPCAGAPEDFDVNAARKVFAQMVDAEQPASQRMTGS